MPNKSNLNPIDANAAVDVVNSELLALHRRRLSRLGRDESGLYEHYERLLARGFILTPVDADRLQFIVEQLPTFDRYVVYRAGLGEFGFALALLGRRVTLWEPNPNRRRAIQEGVAALSNRHRTIGSDLVVAEGPVEEVPLHRGESALGVGLALLLVGEGADEVAAARAIARTDSFLYASRTFLRNRDEALADAEARKLLQAAGYSAFPPIPLSGLALARRILGAPEERQSRLRFAAPDA